MSFQIHPLPYDDYAPLFALSDDELAAQGARRMTVDASPGTPCRVSLRDADVGERVILINYQHQPEDSPYQASHAIFVREAACEAKIGVGDVPEVIRSRLISIRAFDEEHMMIEADVVDGQRVDRAIETAFENPDVRYIHLHIAKPGCFAARVTRVEH
ncbi:MAG: DUF1203 domain-containing protein [Pseudomonadota bacterium]